MRPLAARSPGASQPGLLRLDGLAVQEHLVGQPLLGDLAVELGALEQLLVACRGRRRGPPRAPRSRRPARSSTGGGRSRTSCGPPSPRAARSLMRASVVASTLEVASSRIRMRGCGEQRARDRHPLALAARQGQAALADQRLVAVRAGPRRTRPARRAGRPRGPPRRSRPGARRRCSRAAWPRTGTRRRRPARSRAAASSRSTSRTSAPSISTAPSVDVVEARDQHHERGLARPGGADERDRPAGLDVEVDVAQHRLAAVVGEGHAAQLHPPAARPAAAARPAGAVSCGSRSRISNTRAPEATARCAMPSAMPSIRIGAVSIST